MSCVCVKLCLNSNDDEGDLNDRCCIKFRVPILNDKIQLTSTSSSSSSDTMTSTIR